MSIIGFASQLAMGKDTAADYLNDEMNRLGIFGKWERSAFANAVKETFCTSFGVDRQFLEKWKRIDEAPPGMNMNVRKALQFIGDGFRQIRENIWIEIALRNKGRKLIISDCRYINEAKHIRRHEGINIILYRPNYINDDPNPSESQMRTMIDWCLRTQKEGAISHSTENPPEGSQYYDFFLINDGDIPQMHGKIRNLLIPYIERTYGCQI